MSIARRCENRRLAPSEVVLRALAASEVDLVKWTLFEAVAWNPARELPPYEVVMEHRKLVPYHRDWGRPGDVGVVAELDREVVGVAFFRLFSEDDHGDGFVDEDTPELGIAVAAAHRGKEIGRRLLEKLADAARAQGFAQLCLSVDAENPALRLYERVGYRELTRDEHGVRMLLPLH